MPSIAEKVAYRVLENKGESLTDIAISEGASPTYVRSGALTQTKAFQNVIEKFRAQTTKALQKKTSLALKLITKENLQKSSAKDLMQIVDTGIKNTQLLSGGSTQNVSLAIMLQGIDDRPAPSSDTE